MYYREVEIKDGKTVEPIQFVAIHPVRWPTYLKPTAAFVEADGIEEKLTAAEALAEALKPFVDFWNSPEPRFPLEEDYKRARAALRQYREATK